MRIPDRTGVIAGYRVWRVIPTCRASPSESLYAQTCHRNWSLREPTVAYCPPRVQVDPNKPLLVSGCESAPSFGCACGLYARYEPIREDYLLPYVVGSVLAWGRVVHHEGRSFFRAEKALPIAFVRPRGGRGMYTRQESEGKFFRVADSWGPRCWGAGGTARVHRARGAQVVVIKAGGEEKPEREEVVEPLEEPTPDRYKERRKEKVPGEEPEKVAT